MDEDCVHVDIHSSVDPKCSKPTIVPNDSAYSAECNVVNHITFREPKLHSSVLNNDTTLMYDSLQKPSLNTKFPHNDD